MTQSQPEQPESTRPGPDFIGIGVQRCGTTWISERLKEHPDVFLYPGKEAMFWTHYYHRGYRWYENLFAGKGSRVRGEISPTYFFSPRPEIGRLQRYPRFSIQSWLEQWFRPDYSARDGIKERYPDCKVFAVFRNPADRAWSYYWHWTERRKKRGKERHVPEFDKMFRDDGRWIRYTGLYGTLLRHWREVFPDLGVFLHDDMVKDPAAFMGSIYRFLGVDDTFVGNIDKRENATHPPRMDPEIRKRVLEFYANEIEDFSREIGKKVPWLHA